MSLRTGHHLFSNEEDQRLCYMCKRISFTSNLLVVIMFSYYGHREIKKTRQWKSDYAAWI